MTNYERVMTYTKEEFALFLAHDRYKLLKPLMERMGCGVEEQVVYMKILKWLESEENENDL